MRCEARHHEHLPEHPAIKQVGITLGEQHWIAWLCQDALADFDNDLEALGVMVVDGIGEDGRVKYMKCKHGGAPH